MKPRTHAPTYPRTYTLAHLHLIYPYLTHLEPKHPYPTYQQYGLNNVHRHMPKITNERTNKSRRSQKDPTKTHIQREQGG